MSAAAGPSTFSSSAAPPPFRGRRQPRRFGVRGQLVADDLAPAGLQRLRPAAEPLVQRLDEAAEPRAGRARRTPRRTCPFGGEDRGGFGGGGQVARHGTGILAVARARASGFAAPDGASIKGHGYANPPPAAARLVRRQRAVLPWRVGPKARGRRQGRSLPRLALRGDAAADHGAARDAAIFSSSPAAGRRSRTWPRAEDGEVMAAWAGLGYYARARNLLACARVVAGEHGGAFRTRRRVCARCPAWAAIRRRPSPRSPSTARRTWSTAMSSGWSRASTPWRRRCRTPSRSWSGLAAKLAKAARPGDWAQALMDLGAMVCRPKAPLCDRCPLARGLRQRGQAARGDLPASRARRPTGHPRMAAAFVLVRGGEVALIRRAAEGLCSAACRPPTTDAARPGCSGWPRRQRRAWRGSVTSRHRLDRRSRADAEATDPNLAGCHVRRRPSAIRLQQGTCGALRRLPGRGLGPARASAAGR